MGWTTGGGIKGLFPTGTPHPPSQACARVTVPRLIALGVRRCRLCRVCCWLWWAVVVGVCHLAPWGFWVSFVSLFGFCPLCFASIRVGSCGCFLSFDAGRCGWCSSFGALWLLPALGCLSFGGCVWCLLFGALGFLGLLLTLGCLSLFLLLCLALVFWGSGASARPGVFVFFPWVVVLVFVFWRYGASACFAAFLFLLVAAAGMCPTAPLRLLLMVGVLFCASGFVCAGG